MMEYVSKHYPKIKVLVLTAHHDENTLKALIEKGANGFFNKETNLDNILDAIKLIVKFDYYFHTCSLKRIV